MLDQGQGLYEPHGPRIDVSRGPAHGIALGLGVALVFWASIAVWLLA